MTPPVRLAWDSDGLKEGFDGTWRPTSRDAAPELRTLVPLVAEHLGGPVTRISLNIDAWGGGDQPRRLTVGERVVRLGWFHTLDAATVTLGRGTLDRVSLAVRWDADQPKETK